MHFSVLVKINSDMFFAVEKKGIVSRDKSKLFLKHHCHSAPRRNSGAVQGECASGLTTP